MTITGKPAISDVRGDRALSVAISNIRQRIEAIEGSLGIVESTVQQSSSTGSTQFSVVLQQIAALKVSLAEIEGDASSLADQIAVRVFMPHAPARERDVADTGAQIATRAFAARTSALAAAAPAPPPEDQSNQLAVRAFMPHVPLVPPAAAAPAPPPEDAGNQIAVRAFMHHVSVPAPGDNATRILENQVFGA